MNSTVESLKALLPQVEEHRKTMSEDATAIRRRIVELKREAASIRKRPIRREDFAALVQADIDRHADQQRQRFTNSFTAVAMRDVSVSLAEVLLSVGERTIHSAGTRIFGSPCSVSERFGGTDDNLLIGSALFLFRDAVKAAAADAIAHIDPWPYKDAQPMSDAFKRLGEIDAELTTLEADLAELISTAAQIGISLSLPVEPMPSYSSPPPVLFDFTPTRENSMGVSLRPDELRRADRG